MKKVHELVGQRFGKLTVVKEVPRKDRKHVRWLCLCDCGRSVEPTTDNLRSGNTKSCGCSRAKHGYCQNGELTREYGIYARAKERAKAKGMPFDLKPEDIVIPEFCPVLTDIKLNKHTKERQFDSPSIDKLIPSLGYVKSNICIISWRANEIKRDASLEELVKVTNWVKSQVEEKDNAKS
jgi:hypothetical protein